MPETATEKLRSAADGKEMSYDEYEAVLKARLTPDEHRLYQEELNSAATAPNSVTTGTIGPVFGAIVVVCGMVATLAGGWFGDFLRARQVRGAYFHAACQLQPNALNPFVSTSSKSGIPPIGFKSLTAIL